jgi:hypothetical protein
MLPLADRLVARQSEYGAKIAELSRSDLVDHLRHVLRQALKTPPENPFRNVAVIKSLLIEDASFALVCGFDPRTLHHAIAQCIIEGVELPGECVRFLAQGVAEPQSLRRKKGKTHQALHHEIWRLCRALKEYRQIPLASGESKPTRSDTGDTAFGLLAEAAKNLRKTSNLSKGQVRDIFYEREKAYREMS